MGIMSAPYFETSPTSLPFALPPHCLASTLLLRLDHRNIPCYRPPDRWDLPRWPPGFLCAVSPGSPEMARRPNRTVTVKMPGGPDLEVAVDRILVPQGAKIDLTKDYGPGITAGYKDKEAAARKLAAKSSGSRPWASLTPP